MMKTLIRELQAHGVIRNVHAEEMCQPASPHHSRRHKGGKNGVNGTVYETLQHRGNNNNKRQMIHLSGGVPGEDFAQTRCSVRSAPQRTLTSA